MKKDPIEEARRYVRNAHDTLADNTKVDPETETYVDSKYVRAAGNYLWLGVLIALEAVFHVVLDAQGVEGLHGGHPRPRGVAEQHPVLHMTGKHPPRPQHPQQLRFLHLSLHHPSTSLLLHHLLIFLLPLRLPLHL